MHLIVNGMYGLIKFCVVLVINFSLFCIIPVSQNIFSLFQEDTKKEIHKPRVVAELVKPPKPKKEQKRKTRLRKVTASSSRSIQNPMKFKMAPDLSVAGAGNGAAVSGEEMHAEVFDEGDVDVAATPVFQPKPGFPEKARKLAIEGEVRVTFIVGIDGKIELIESVAAPHVSFNEEIRRAFDQWKFNPAKKKGVPVKSRHTIIIDFALDA